MAANAEAGRPVYWMEEPPTAENMVAELAEVSAALLASTGVEVVRIRLWETPNCSSEWVSRAWFERGRPIMEEIAEPAAS